MARSKRKKAKGRNPARSRLRRSRAWLPGILLLGAVAVVAIVFIGRERSTLPLPAEGFNVLLISMDTTRADHLGCYGHPQIKTPNIDRLASQGTMFTQCMAPVPITLPSHSSMMTGTDPYVHGVRDNGNYYLHGDNETLAEALKASGYATAAEVAAFVLNREFGLNQGFDVYHDTYGPLRRGAGQPGETYAERSAREVADGAITWLRDHGRERFFLFVHFFDAHAPYAPPQPFAAQYSNPYLGEIAFVDEQIGRLLAELKDRDLRKRTLVILTADHGEGLGQHNEPTHSVFVYDATMSVPLIFRCPGRIPAGRSVRAQVRIIDIAPTVLDFLGMEPMANAQGESLLPLLTGQTGRPGHIAYGESMFPMLNLGFAPLRAVREGGWKYIHAPQPELYNVSEDPGELNNLATSEPQRVERMRDHLYELIENAPVVVGAASAKREMSQSELEQLRALGYVGGLARTADEADKSELDLLEPEGLDPKDYVDDINLNFRAHTLKEAGDLEGSEQVLRELLARAGDRSQRYWWPLRDLAMILMEQGEEEEAIEYFEKALSIRPADSVLLTELGLALAKLGRTDEALLRFREAVNTEPVYARTHRHYAQALRLKGETEAAIHHFRRALEMDPQVPEAWYSLGFLLVERGDYAGGLRCWRTGLALSPEDTYMVNNVAWILSTCPVDSVRDGAEAVRLAEAVRDATGGKSPAALHTLAAAYAEQGRFDDALATANRALELATKAGSDVLIQRVKTALRSYSQGQPYREGPARAP